MLKVERLGEASGVVAALREGAVVAKAELGPEPQHLLLPPGTYEIEVVGDGGTRTVVEELTVLRSHCFSESGGEAAPPPRTERVFGFRHDGAHVVLRPDGHGLTLARVYADYGTEPPTRITWHSGATEVTSEPEGTRRTWAGGYEAGDNADRWLHAPGTTAACHTLWAVDARELPIPDAVWRAGGRWTARVVSVGAQPLEVDLEVGNDVEVDPRYASGKVGRSRALAPRPVEPDPEELAWQRTAEDGLTLERHGSGPSHAPPLAVTPALLRASYREAKVAWAFGELENLRVVARSPDVDVAGSVATGVAHGETIAAAERYARGRQVELDADAAAENAYRKQAAPRLRAQLEAWIKQHGGPLGAADLPVVADAAASGRAVGAADVQLRDDGVLDIDATPPCAVLVDGVDTGKQTPVAGLRLRPGNHVLILLDRTTGAKKRLQVSLGPGERRTLHERLGAEP
ncbi:MAG: hypothetical protein IT373_10280 [Polyangiaceae bacterium]|nr:hypothetical protein [Polyangiaceae bacterium]